MSELEDQLEKQTHGGIAGPLNMEIFSVESSNSHKTFSLIFREIEEAAFMREWNKAEFKNASVSGMCQSIAKNEALQYCIEEAIRRFKKEHNINE